MSVRRPSGPTDVLQVPSRCRLRLMSRKAGSCRGGVSKGPRESFACGRPLSRRSVQCARALPLSSTSARLRRSSDLWPSTSYISHGQRETLYSVDRTCISVDFPEPGFPMKQKRPPSSWLSQLVKLMSMVLLLVYSFSPP
jgi:hypothetical protein